MTEPEATPVVTTVTYEDFAKLDFRTAKVLEVTPHPNADRLYVIQLEIGAARKQIVAGIRAFYTPEELVGKTIVVVNNLQPAVLRGQASNGMLLAVRTDGGLAVLTTDRPAGTGLKVS